MNTEATPKQKRYIKFAARKKPLLIQKMLDERGGSIDKLSRQQASQIITAYEEQREDQQDQDKREDQQQQDHQQQDQREQEQNDEQEDKLDDEQDDQKKERKMQRNGFRPGSKQEYIAQALRDNGMDAEATRKALEGKIGQIPTLTFTQNINGARVKLPQGEPTDDSQQPTQYGRAVKTIYAVRRALLAGGEGGEQRQQKQEQKQEHREKDNSREATDLLAWIRQTRKFCLDRAADGHPLDEIGLRPVEYGAKMLRAGIPLAAIKHAITMHYPPEARAALGARDYDVKGFRPNERKEGVHAALPYCKALASERIPIALVGPKGTGKTTLAMDLASELALPFGMVSMTAGTSPSAFNGRPRVADDGTTALVLALTAFTEDDSKLDEAESLARKAAEAGDTVMSLWVKIFGGGGVWLFDEMDAGEPNLVLGTNAALANGVFANPVTGQIVEQHPDFIPVAGMNTLGLGAGRDYTGRNKLDAATLDRWNSGRVQITLDERIEESLFWNIVNSKDNA